MNSIRYKLILSFLLVGILPLLIISTIEYYQITQILQKQAFEQLVSVREVKKNSIEIFFERKRAEIAFFAQSRTVIDAMKEFKAAFTSANDMPVNKDQINALKAYYKKELIDKLPEQVQSQINVDSLLPSTNAGIFLQLQYLTRIRTPFVEHPYHAIHEKYHPLMSRFLNTYEYYDIFLIDDQSGHIIYTVAKEIDFGTSLLSEFHANSNLGDLFRRIRYTGLKNQVIFCDYALYLPSYMAPAAFLAAPIFEGDKKIGTLAFQISINKINQVMTSNNAWKEEGLGNSGETYLVGSDYKMRTDARFFLESPEEYLQKLDLYQTDSLSRQNIQFYKTTILFQSVTTPSVRQALNGQTGIEIIEDYRKTKVLSAYTPLQISDVKWVLIAEIDVEEVLSPVYASAWRIVKTTGLTALGIILIGLAIAYSFIQPINLLVKATEQLSSGNLEARVRISRSDELGILANSFNQMAYSLEQQRQELLKKQAEIQHQKEELAAQAERLRLANEEISMQNEEIRQVMEEIEAQRDSILEKNAVLEQQKEEIIVQSENLQKLNEELQRQNELLNQQKQEIQRQAVALELANRQVSQVLAELSEKQQQLQTKNEQIIDSIKYAKRIQQALLPPVEAIAEVLPESFVLFIPRDIVSGDFYWFAQKDNTTFLAVVDCTGHGVPGAMMSVMAHNLLHKIILYQNNKEPGRILEEMHIGVRELLNQEITNNRDGMEIALCAIDRTQGIMHFAGAGLPLCYVENGQLYVIKGERYSVGGNLSNIPNQYLTFQQHSFSLNSVQRTFYIYSDGFQDQFGGSRNQKYMSKRFRNLLHALSFMPMSMQYERLQQEFVEWKGNEEQTDDVLVIGFKI
ncbi:MAG: SpoIIE family protein phosphatase [Cytophagales bacterium]|nr:SpoIIE family protein phosphatase [Bernardetiaceae bacterium]MDW8209978.1 SpoIIE family protein phosphatase [Cytophagales bacterium]